jgi:hypothetical protein
MCARNRVVARLNVRGTRSFAFPESRMKLRDFGRVKKRVGQTKMSVHVLDVWPEPQQYFCNPLPHLFVRFHLEPTAAGDDDSHRRLEHP